MNEKKRDELFRINVSLEDRKERWHFRFKKLLDEIISRCKICTEVDSDPNPIFKTALKSATYLRKNLVSVFIVFMYLYDKEVV